METCSFFGWVHLNNNINNIHLFVVEGENEYSIRSPKLKVGLRTNEPRKKKEELSQEEKMLLFYDARLIYVL